MARRSETVPSNPRYLGNLVVTDGRHCRRKTEQLLARKAQPPECATQRDSQLAIEESVGHVGGFDRIGWLELLAQLDPPPATHHLAALIPSRGGNPSRQLLRLPDPSQVLEEPEEGRGEDVLTVLGVQALVSGGAPHHPLEAFDEIAPRGGVPLPSLLHELHQGDRHRGEGIGPGSSCSPTGSKFRTGHGYDLPLRRSWQLLGG